MKKISIVLPTFNEVGSLEKFIPEVFSQEKNIPGWKIEIIISDSHSIDGTVDVAKMFVEKNKNIHLISVGPGLGVGLVEGHRYALKNIKPDILAQLDADGQVDANVIPKLVRAIEDGYTLALGSRFVKGGKNELSFSRRLFTAGSSLVCRVLMGPISVREFTNSARAFTPELFNKINWQRMPWREKTFITQPAFLNEAILAGAKYKEVPLIFRNRAEGYSKNKTVNYTYDVVTYAIDARLNQWGIKVPFYRSSRRAKVIFKFGMVGFTGTLIDFIFYKIFINVFSLPPATSKAFSTEIAIINNFLLNNYWTFRGRKTNTNFWQKLGIFNLVSLGGLGISVLIIKLLHNTYGDGTLQIAAVRAAYNNFYFFATIPLALIWNFTANHFITWRHKKG